MSDQSNPLQSRRSQRSWLRMVLLPALVLLTAASLVYYGQQQRQQEREQVRVEAAMLCRETAAMSRGGAMPEAARDLQASLTTIEQLHRVIHQHDPDLSTLDIAVERGDASPPYGDGSATHQAHIKFDGETRISLRFVHDAQQDVPALIGFWLPREAESGSDRG